MTRILLTALTAGGVLLATPGVAQPGPDEFQSTRECTAGRRVADRENLKGTVIGLAKESPRILCEVRWDTAARKNRYVIHWSLRPEGAGAKPGDAAASPK
jgi:hypothetical protein